MADNAADCKVNGRLPLGYKNVGGYYAIDEPNAAIVREIFERFLSKETFAGIAADLNQRGIKTGYGNLWNKCSFHRLLKNDNYIGTYHNSGVVKENGIPSIVTNRASLPPPQSPALWNLRCRSPIWSARWQFPGA